MRPVVKMRSPYAEYVKADKTENIYSTSIPYLFFFYLAWGPAAIPLGTTREAHLAVWIPLLQEEENEHCKEMLLLYDKVTRSKRGQPRRAAGPRLGSACKIDAQAVYRLCNKSLSAFLVYAHFPSAASSPTRWNPGNRNSAVVKTKGAATGPSSLLWPLKLLRGRTSGLAELPRTGHGGKKRSWWMGYKGREKTLSGRCRGKQRNDTEGSWIEMKTTIGTGEKLKGCSSKKKPTYRRLRGDSWCVSCSTDILWSSETAGRRSCGNSSNATQEIRPVYLK